MNISQWDPKVWELQWELQNSIFITLIRKNKIRRIFNLPDERVPF